MIRTLKVFSILLCYPTAEIQRSAGQLKSVIRDDNLIEPPLLDVLLSFLNDYEKRELYDLQERYVLLFDRTRSLSLHLFEHIHGESRERGQAMINLVQMYEQHSLAIEARELPDYLPMFLEFLSLQPLAESRKLLGEIQHIIKALEQRLSKRGSPYAEIFKGIQHITQGNQTGVEIIELLNLPDDNPQDLEALDRAWEEEPVRFGPDSVTDGLTGIYADTGSVRVQIDPRPRAKNPT